VSVQSPDRDSSTITTDLLQWRARRQSDDIAYTFLLDGEAQEVSISYRELDQKARSVAARLQETTQQGERVLLLYPSGLEYIIAFLGCLYAGVVAVPMYPPRFVRSDRSWPRLLAIKHDTRATTVLTISALLHNTETLFTELLGVQGLQFLTTDTCDPAAASQWVRPDVTQDSLAFLQYTSGSTGAPRGVMVTHGNLFHNYRMLHGFGQVQTGEIIVSWLPLYHDMGLIGNILYPIYAGARVVLMAPVAFLQRPLRWLQAISRYQAICSGGPNFAYEMCVRKITEDQRATLDLSCWQMAFCGSEPVRPVTLERFAETFASCGFRREALSPSYGLAEATLFVTGTDKRSVPRLCYVQEDALQANRVVPSPLDGAGRKALVSNGLAHANETLRIVDPHTLRVCEPDQVGEIWIASPSIAQGYWNKPNETTQAFHLYTSDTAEGPFLRSGDLGFLWENELYLTGRSKDLIIIRGRNLYPQDIELTVAQSHEVLRADAGAAFSIDVQGEEQLVVINEVERTYRYVDSKTVMSGAVRAIAETYEIQPYRVLFIKMGTLPRTSSGKVQRHLARLRYQANELEIVGESHG
jgi:acyl-CoA synthetase (AMP-forming)/AMP-acid ligase II